MTSLPSSYRWRLITLTVGTVAVVAGAAWIIFAQAFEPAEIAKGQRIYAAYCASCHGVRLEGEPDWKTRLPTGRLPAPPHDASGHTWHHSDDDLFRIVKGGLTALVPGYESDMPAFGDSLSDDQIRAVLNYIKSRWPERERSYQARRSELPQ